VIAYLIAVALAANVQSPFTVRGIKGLWWEGIDKYEKALPWLAEHDLNFLMLCYSSFKASGADWRSDYTTAEKEQFRKLAEEGRRGGVTVCLSFNPGIWSKPALTYSSEDDYAMIIGKVRSIHALGVRWFALCLDDINTEQQPNDKTKFGTLQDAQVYLVNRLWDDMKAMTPRPTLIFCPSAYTTESARANMAYIKRIGDIDPDVMMFWTGPEVRSPSITAKDAQEFGKWIKRKPFVWDNYPVNDDGPWRPYLCPLKNRSADLGGAVSGYLANPMKQWYASTIPLESTASYLCHPSEYDPKKALESLLTRFEPKQRETVRLLVKLYGSKFLGEKDYPTDIHKVPRDEAKNRLNEYYRLQTLLQADSTLANLYADVRPTLEQDISDLARRARDRAKESPLKAMGDDFDGGAGSVYGYRYFDRPVNYVYARSTGKNRMSASFYLASPIPATLRLTARMDDRDSRFPIRISINGHVIVEGDSSYDGKGFSTKEFPVAASMLKKGANRLVIENLVPTGGLGMPPWFMVSEAEFVITDGLPRGSLW
jgi:hypothetical protein